MNNRPDIDIDLDAPDPRGDALAETLGATRLYEKVFGTPITMTHQVWRAYELASWEHREQRRKDGEPYVAHVLRVAVSVDRAAKGRDDHDDMVAAAMLHDVVEDTKVTLIDLVMKGFSGRTVDLVERLSRVSGENYSSFIERIAMDEGASIIKRADLADNISTLEFGNPLWKRYVAALAFLNKSRS